MKVDSWKHKIEKRVKDINQELNESWKQKIEKVIKDNQESNRKNEAFKAKVCDLIVQLKWKHYIKYSTLLRACL